MLRSLFILQIIILLLAAPLSAQVPNHVNYQGRLTDGQGTPVTGNRTMAVRVYNSASGGNITYQETIGTVAVRNGTYSFSFGGSGNSLAAALTGQDFLALSVNGTEEATRSRLLAVPFAFKAKTSETSTDVQALRSELLMAGILRFAVVEGGVLPQGSQIAGTSVGAFRISKHEVTWDEWQDVRGWAVNNGYTDLANVGAGSGGNHPVRDVSWYDVVKWSNAKSEREGLLPVYSVNGTVYRTGNAVPSVNSSANGYRLPTDAEWEWAARGGVLSKGYVYSGSNDANAVAWFSGNNTQPVGAKAANEIGLHDMSGNVWEWCFDAFDANRRVRGGSWSRAASECSVANRNTSGNPTIRINEVGFRLARNAGL
jgi:hypothetical protein